MYLESTLSASSSPDSYRLTCSKVNRDSGRRVISLLLPRLMMIAAGLLYAWILHFAHGGFLNAAWGYYGFLYRDPTSLEAVLIALAVVLGSAVVPKFVWRPSSAVLLLLFVVVYVPTVVITPCLGEWWLQEYGAALLSLCLSFSVACIAVNQQRIVWPASASLPDPAFAASLLIVWMLACAALLYNYASIMTFAGLEAVYEQRAVGTSTSLGLGYLQTYFSTVLSPALLALGLVNRRNGFAVLGTLGCLLMYAITAQRTVFLLPLVIIVFHSIQRSRAPFLKASALPVVAVALAVLVAALFYSENEVAALLSTYLVFRTLAIPGLTFSQYWDVFSLEGFTYWSHVRGVEFLVEPPRSLAADPSWPGLGYIIGDRLYANPANNVNANLFSGDGVAAAGALGVLLIGLLLAIWLVLLDRSSARWSRQFALLVTLPIGLSLTNGHFTTTLLSFGGLFWLVIFYFWPVFARQFTGKANENRNALRLLQRSVGVSGKPSG